MVGHQAEVVIVIKTRDEGTRQATQQLGLLGKAFDGFQGASTKAFGAAAIGAMVLFKGVQLLSEGVRRLVDLSIESVKAFAEFDFAMQQIGIIAGLTGSAVATLSDDILRMASQGMYGAKDLSSAFTVLAQMGYTDVAMAKEMVTAFGALATVTSTDLNTSVTLGAQMMRVFGDDVSSATEMANILTDAVNQTNLTMTDFSFALQYVSANASITNTSIQQTSALLGLLSDNAFTASTAGTSLSAMMEAIIDPSAAAKAAMRQLQVSVYNADGSMRNIVDIIADVNNATKDMTEEQRNNYITTIFSTRAFRAAVTIMNELNDSYGGSAEAFNTYADSLGQGVNVIDKQNELLKTAQGFLTIATNTWEALQITIGDITFTNAVKGFEATEQTLGTLNFSGDGFTKIFTVVGALVGQLGYLFGLLGQTLNIVLQILDPFISTLGAGLAVGLLVVSAALKGLNDLLLANKEFLQLVVGVLTLYISYLVITKTVTMAVTLAQGAHLLIQKLLNYEYGAGALGLALYYAAVIATTAYEWLCTAATIALDVALTVCSAGLWKIVQIIGLLIIAVITIITAFDKWGEVLALVKGLVDGFLQTLGKIYDAVAGLLGPFAEFVMSFFPHSDICLSYGLELSTKNMKDFQQQLRAMDREVAMSTPTMSTYGGGIMAAAEGYSGGGSTTSNTVNITIQGDVKDDETIQRFTRTINQLSRGSMFIG